MPATVEGAEAVLSDFVSEMDGCPFFMGFSAEWCHTRQLVEGRDLVERQRSGQVIHCPADLEDARCFGMHVLVEEYPLGEGGDDPVIFAACHAAGGAFQSVQQALLVLVGLQAADHPGAGIGHGFVIHIHRVLGGEYQSHPKGARLLHHADHDRFGSRDGHRRQVAQDFIKINQRAQVAGPALGAHPRFDGGEQQGDKKHTFGFIQVGDVKDAVADFAVLAV